MKKEITLSILLTLIGFSCAFSQFQVQGTVYMDANGNGTQDSFENGIPNLEVEISDAATGGNVINFLTTNTNGVWSMMFPNMSTATEYYVYVLENNAAYPTNIVITEGANPGSFIVNNGGIISGTTNLGFFPSGILQGNLFHDFNTNGVKDGSDVGIPNIDILITDALGITSTLSTDTNGDWSIVVPEGNTISEVDLTDPDFPFDPDSQTSGTNPTTDLVGAGENVESEPDGFFDPLLLVKENSIQKIAFYPNPVRNEFHFKNYSGKVKIIDLLGKVIIEINVVANQNLDISKLPKGTYFIKIEESDKTIRLIKE